MLKVVVYCSSVDNLPDAWRQGAIRTGQWIGRNKAQLVYGGVDSGLMKITAAATKDAGGTVVGIVPARRRNMASPLNDVVVPTSDLNDRKGVMQMLGDIFVVLPGGYGTLDEFTTSFSYLNFTQVSSRPIIIYNASGLFNPLLTQLKVFVDNGLMPAENLDIITVANTPDELVKALDKAAGIE